LTLAYEDFRNLVDDDVGRLSGVEFKEDVAGVLPRHSWLPGNETESPGKDKAQQQLLLSL